MNFSLYIARRISKNEARSFSVLIVKIAAIAIALSVAVMIISSSMVNGFRTKISENIYGFWGHINIAKESLRNSYDDLPISKNESFINELNQIQGVENVQVYARKAGIIKSKTNIDGIILKGIDNDFNWEHFKKYLIAGNKLDLSDSLASKGIILSKSTANRLGFQVGDSVILHFIDIDVNGDYQQRFRKLRVDGIYNTGLEEFDKLFALADIRHIQKLNSWNADQIGGYEVFIKESSDLTSITKEVDLTADPFWQVQTIQQIIPSIFDWLNLQKVNERIILILMMVVAVINMITSLLILILERTSMIGILKALGAENWSIRKIFLINAISIITKGLFWGNIIGILVCLVQHQFGFLKLPEQSYYVSTVPVSLNVLWILLLNAGTFCVCFFALIVPSYLVTRIKPVNTIRFA